VTIPRSWIDQIYGSQALLAHVETIIGWEQDGELFTLATVPRSFEPVILTLEKQDGSLRFELAGAASQVRNWTKTQRDHWKALPAEFSRAEGDEIVGHSTLDRLIRKGVTAGMLKQDNDTKRYTKVGTKDALIHETDGIISDNKQLIDGTASGTSGDVMGRLPVSQVPEQSQLEYLN
jgi:hypothetical protein